MIEHQLLNKSYAKLDTVNAGNEQDEIFIGFNTEQIFFL